MFSALKREMCMFSVPYSRYIFAPIPWYSFLIVLGVALAVFLACREERRLGLKKDTVIDLALWVLPFGIIGARVYYVFFSWDQFRSDPLSVLKIWEGGIAIYGAVIAGLLTVFVFARCRNLPPLLLCDLIAPGLALAQAIGRWGNYFNMEAYGLPVTQPALCFFPLAVQIPENGFWVWHMATFFYESVWDFSVFVFLMLARHRMLCRRGDVFFFYLYLYAAGRFVIEDLRMDSLYASSAVRVSQLLSALLCLLLLIWYFVLLWNSGAFKGNLHGPVAAVAFISSCFQLFYSLSPSFLDQTSLSLRLLLLAGSSFLLIFSLFLVYIPFSQEVCHANNKV